MNATRRTLANYHSVCCKCNDLSLNWQQVWNTATQLQLQHVTWQYRTVCPFVYRQQDMALAVSTSLTPTSQPRSLKWTKISLSPSSLPHRKERLPGALPHSAPSGCLLEQRPASVQTGTHSSFAVTNINLNGDWCSVYLLLRHSADGLRFCCHNQSTVITLTLKSG